MNRPRILRILRIGTSAVCAIACLLLIALWVRSHRHVDLLQTQKTPHGLVVSSGRGTISTTSYDLPEPVDSREWQFDSYPLESPDEYPEPPLLGFGLNHTPGASGVIVPYWFLTLTAAIIATLASLPWLRSPRRFGLRTLLLATTFVAIQLGLIVWLR